MNLTSVQKLARVVRVLIVILFVCNLIALLLVPGLACILAAGGWPVTVTVCRGLYSVKIPLIPLWVEVTELENFIIDGNMERGVEFTVHYLWFGSLGMRYLSGDGYSVTKPLTGL